MAALLPAPWPALFALAVVLMLLAVLPASRGPGRKKVLIVGIDGCRPDALVNASTPRLKRLIQNGAFSERAQTSAPTQSGPCWASMLTGVWPGKPGIRDTDFGGARLDRYPHFFHRLKEHRPDAITASVVNWAPINDRIVTAADIVWSGRPDRRLAATAAHILREQDPDALFVQFDEVDQAGHDVGFGPDVPAYVQAVERTDVLVGELFRALERRQASGTEDWLVLAGSDHAGSGKDHGRDVPEHRTVFLIVSGPSAARGTMSPPPGVVDVAATALAHLGVPLDPRWGLDGRPVGLREPAPHDGLPCRPSAHPGRSSPAAETG